MKANIAMFDWNGNLDEQIKADGVHFNLKFTKLGEPDMGFTLFEVEGDAMDLDAFLQHYELELEEGSVQ